MNNLVYSWFFTIFLIKKGRPGLNGKKGAKGDSGGGYGNGYQVKNYYVFGFNCYYKYIYYILLISNWF